MSPPAFTLALSQVPPGPWAVGVSGGADSVALLSLLRTRPDLTLHIVHLDHETRQGGSAADAAFVAQLARGWNLDCTIAQRSAIERTMSELPSNRSARYRAARLQFFHQVVREKNLQGVILAHHADDQAETIALRLLRGSSFMGLRGMSPRARIHNTLILRPLLSIPRQELRQHLRAHNIPWREDVSNQSLDQRRNRVRRLLQNHPGLTTSLLRLAVICDRWFQWLEKSAPVLEESFPTTSLQDLAQPLAEFAARRWLTQRSGHFQDVTEQAAQRLIAMATDAATPPRQHFPGGILVRRRAGRIFIDLKAPSKARWSDQTARA